MRASLPAASLSRACHARARKWIAGRHGCASNRTVIDEVVEVASDAVTTVVGWVEIGVNAVRGFLGI